MSKVIKVSKKVKGLSEALNGVFTELLKDSKALLKAYNGEEFQTQLLEILKKHIPKTPKVKKLLDPKAPKKPSSAYIHFCNDKRESVKKANPEMKGKEIISELGRLWKELSDRKKDKYKVLADEAKEKYKTEMVDYERPSDDELEKLVVNKNRGRSLSGGKTKKKKDPNAPKHPVSAYLYFCSDKRPQVKEANEDMSPTDVSKELGRMWKEDYTSEKSRKKYVKLAEKDKERYVEEMKSYVPKKEKEVESKDEDEGDEEEEKGDEEDVKEEKKEKKKEKKIEVIVRPLKSGSGRGSQPVDSDSDDE